MSLGKQAKVLSKTQVTAIRGYLLDRRNGLRNETMFLLSVKAGLRAKEIASLTWSMVLNADGTIASDIRLTDKASKGKSGRVIPLNTDVAGNLTAMLSVASGTKAFTPSDRVITSERSDAVSSQMVVNSFRSWYRELGLEGCSSHSGRRTFITNTARLISTCGGSLRDVQMMAGHASLQMTQTYIEGDSQSRSKVVNLL
jgi:integrase/recombinase XerD